MAEVLSGVMWGLVPPLVFDALPGGGIAFSDSSAYATKITQPSGEVLRVLRRPIDPGPATDRARQAEKDRELARLGLSRDLSGRVPPDVLALAGVFRAAHARAIEDMQFFPEVPVLHALRTMWEGNVWVQRRGEDPTWTADRSTCSHRPAVIWEPSTGECGCLTNSARTASSCSSKRTSSMCRSSW